MPPGAQRFLQLNFLLIDRPARFRRASPSSRRRRSDLSGRTRVENVRKANPDQQEPVLREGGRPCAGRRRTKLVHSLERGGEGRDQPARRTLDFGSACTAWLSASRGRQLLPLERSAGSAGPQPAPLQLLRLRSAHPALPAPRRGRIPVLLPQGRTAAGCLPRASQVSAPQRHQRWDEAVECLTRGAGSKHEASPTHTALVVGWRSADNALAQGQNI